MFAKKKYNHLLLVYIVINNCYRQDAIYKQLASYACIARFCNQVIGWDPQ